MNYRHIFHAGNLCDVAKHAVLTLILRHLRDKDKAFAVLDTHAGIGRYDLLTALPQKTREAQAGVLALLAAPPIPLIADYYDVLRTLNPSWASGTADAFRFYPGSPLLTFHLLRPQDRLVACELHPEDAASLRRLMPRDRRVQLHERDGYGALRAFLPPPEKRGLVLIDPPFEKPDEFSTLAHHLIDAHKRWPTGTYAVWYPVKDRPAIWKFEEALVAAGIPKLLRTEFIYDESSGTDKLVGSGMLIVNPPWKLDEDIKELFAALHEALKTPHGKTVVSWLSVP